MVDFFVADAAPAEGIARHERFIDEVRDLQFANLINRIDSTSDDLEFGTPISRILSEYRFASRKHTSDFFARYLERRHGAGHVDEAMVRKYVDATVNCSTGPSEAEPDDTAGSFKTIAAEFVETVDRNSRSSTPTVQYIVGPTGSGKTAFSRALFTIALRQFWEARIVPSRVEYSKLSNSPENGLDTKSFYELIRHCQARDLLVYFFHSGTYSVDERTSLIAGLRLNNAQVPLQQYNAGSELVVDGESTPVGSELRSAIRKLLREIESSRELDNVLYRLSPKLKVRYLVSFDGFDTIRIEHFLFRDKVPSPIMHLAQLLRGWFEKSMENVPHQHYLDVHYLAYVRDTTFERLRAEVHKRIASRNDIPRLWIVPPKYELLVDNAIRHIVQRPSYGSAELARSIAGQIEALFDRYVFKDGTLRAAQHMHFAFGSSARSMKRHIKYTFFSAIQRGIQSGEIEERRRAGVDPVWLVETVNRKLKQRFPQYVVFEDLFLNDTRHLMPKLRVGHNVLAGLIEAEDLDGIVAHVGDRDEDTGIYGCVFNYLFHCTVAGQGGGRQSGLLLLVRAIQYVARHHRCSSGEVYSFLRALGYDVSEFCVQIVLYVLLRAELVKWDGSSGTTRIEDVPLFVTTRGAISITKLPFIISYVSEGMVSSLQTDRRIRDALIRRDPDNQRWIADCISNASIGLAVVKDIEAIELQNAQAAGIDMTGYLLFGEMSDELGRQAQLILEAGSGRTPRRWAENELALRGIAGWLPTLHILGGG